MRGKRLTTEEFIERAKSVHGEKYDYSKVEYTNWKTKVQIKCNACGNIFLQRPDTHLIGRGCSKCSVKRTKLALRKTNEIFIKNSIAVHGNNYDYSLVNYINASTKVKILCNECFNIFEQTPHNHLRGRGCPFCKSSHGETFIKKYLQEHNIQFEEQKKFEDCKNKLPLPFDFYLPDYNLCIEYQGIQHFEPREQFGGVENFKKQQQNDAIKKAWCSQPENPDLLEITYKDNVEEKISCIFNSQIRSLF